MHGQLSQETPVGLPASVVWEAYRGLELGRLVTELLPHSGTVEAVEGDGEIGTIIKVTFPQGTPGIGYMKERFIKMDDDKRIKEAETIEGGYKDLGFHHVIMRFEIIEKDSESSIIKSSIEYDIDDQLADIVSHLTTKPLETTAEAIRDYLTQKKAVA